MLFPHFVCLVPIMSNFGVTKRWYEPSLLGNRPRQFPLEPLLHCKYHVAFLLFAKRSSMFHLQVVRRSFLIHEDLANYVLEDYLMVCLA